MEWLFGKKKTAAGRWQLHGSPSPLPSLTWRILNYRHPKGEQAQPGQVYKVGGHDVVLHIACTLTWEILIRELDRERMGLEQQEKKIVVDIKRMAKEGQMVRGRVLKILISMHNTVPS